MNPYYNHHGYDAFERRRTEYMGLFHMLRILNIFKIDGTGGDGINGSVVHAALRRIKGL